MHGPHIPVRFYRRPEYQLPLVVFVAIAFVAATCVGLIPTTVIPFLGIAVRSEIVGLFFGSVFLLLSILTFKERDTPQRQKERIEAVCVRVKTLLVKKETLDDAQRRFASEYQVRNQKPAKQYAHDWSNFLQWCSLHNANKTELWYYSTNDPRDLDVPRECGYAIVENGVVTDRWQLWSIDISYGASQASGN